MTDLSIKNLAYVDNFKHTIMGNFANFKAVQAAVNTGVSMVSQLLLLVSLTY